MCYLHTPFLSFIATNQTWGPLRFRPFSSIYKSLEVLMFYLLILVKRGFDFFPQYIGSFGFIFLLITQCLIMEGKSVLPTCFPYLENFHGGLIMWSERELNTYSMCPEPERGSTQIVDYLSIIAHSNLVRLPYFYTLSHDSILIIIFHVMSIILFQCAISTHC